MAIPAQLQSFWSGKQRFAMLRDSPISALLTLSIKVKPQTLRKNPIIASYSFLAIYVKQSTCSERFAVRFFDMLCFFCQGYLNNGRSGISAVLQLNCISRLQFNSIAEFAALLHSLREVQLELTSKKKHFHWN